MFRDPAHIMLAVKVSHCHVPDCGRVDLILNSGPPSRFNLEPNEWGEIRTHIAIPGESVTDGEHYAIIKVVNEYGHELADHLYHDVGFLVNTSSPGGRTDAAPDTGGVFDTRALAACPVAPVCSDWVDDDALGALERGDGDGCSGHGKCVRGACVCAGGWCGERCDHPIFENNTYVPETDPATSPSRCVKALFWEQGAQELGEQLSALAARTSCGSQDVLRFEAPPHGLGTNLHYMTVLLSKALQEGKALVMDEGTKWNYDACDGLGYECHFQPLSACQAAQAAAAGTPLHRRADEIRYEHPDAHDSHFVPAEWRGYTHGVLWWRAQLTGFLLRPQERLRARLRQVKNMIGFSHPVVGLQVRRGDSCEHASSSAIRPGCAPLDKYAELVLAMAARYDVRLVFLATDDAEAVRYLRAACAKEGLEVITLSVDRSVFESSLFIEYRLMLGYVDKAAVADSTMLDLLLLAEADYFVGGFGSHFGRLAFELSVAAKGRVPAYASVDYPWFWHVVCVCTCVCLCACVCVGGGMYVYRYVCMYRCWHFLESRPIGPWPSQFC